MVAATSETAGQMSRAIMGGSLLPDMLRELPQSQYGCNERHGNKHFDKAESAIAISHPVNQPHGPYEEHEQQS